MTPNCANTISNTEKGQEIPLQGKKLHLTQKELVPGLFSVTN